MKKLITLGLVLITFSSLAQTIAGKWKTIDDDTGKERSIVEIYEKDGKFFGRIMSLYREPGEDPDPICDDCDKDDPRFNQKVIGMEIIQNMKFDKGNNEYDSGTILDPENGSVYDCKLWVGEDGKLRVRGYIMFFYRTQVWLPAE